MAERMAAFDAINDRIGWLKAQNEKREKPIRFDLDLFVVNGVEAGFSDGSTVNLVHGQMDDRQHMAYLLSRLGSV